MVYMLNYLNINNIRESNLSKNPLHSGKKQHKVAGVCDTFCDTK
jgi:hypothetical protein